MRTGNVMNVERYSRKETLQGISRFTLILGSHVKFVQRRSTERTSCKNMLKDCTKKNCTNVISARKHLLTSVTSRYTGTRVSGSQTTYFRSKSSQSRPRFSRLPFWPAGFILPPIIEILMIYFFQYGSFGGGVGPGNLCPMSNI